MRKLLLYLFILSASTLQAQNVGINTTAPQAMLHVKDSSVLFSGPTPFVNYDPASMPPAQGAGTRLMWYAPKGAFRAGWVEDNRWDKDSIGIFSVALGHSALASYTGSVSLGIRTQSRNFASTALGYNTQANAEYSFAAGYESKAQGQVATAIGAQNNALGFFSTAIGNNNTTSNTSSVALGESNHASGVSAVAVGSNIRVKARAAFATGWYNDTNDFPDPTFIAPTDRLFQIGNGNGFFGTYSNALTVLRNGNHGLGTVNPLARLHVADSSVVFTGPTFLSGSTASVPISGSGARLMWLPNVAAFRAGYAANNSWDNSNIGFASIALGYDTKAVGSNTVSIGFRSAALESGAIAIGTYDSAIGISSLAMGNQTIASGYQSTTMGWGTVAAGYNATAIGNSTKATGDWSTAMGANTAALGVMSTATGAFTKAKSDYSFVLGKYNDTTNTNRIFEVGNGTDNNTRRNALTVLQNGNTGIGTTNPTALLHVTEKDVLFSATGPIPGVPADPPVSGTGRRMMWYADKAAFRAGYVDGNLWDKDNVGDHSFVLGKNSIASGTNAIAVGFSNTASGAYSVSMGNSSIASGSGGIAIGSNAVAKGFAATSMGYQSSSAGLASFSMGYNTIAKSDFSMVVGKYNDTTNTNRLFEIGNGISNGARSNAVTVLSNGNMGIGTTNPTRPISFPPALGEKILLYPGGAGEVGIGVYGNELRLHADNPGAKVSFGTQTNAGVFTEAGKFEINGVYAMTVFGSIWANGTTYASDERFKQNITPIANPLEKLLQINGVEYEMKSAEFAPNNFAPGRQMGLLAQNIEKVVPEAVHEKDGYKGVDYARLVPLLVESIKAQQVQINNLQQELLDLRQQTTKQ